VHAVDRDPARLARLDENARRLGIPLETTAHDWSRGPLPQDYGHVLVDAPCTALGTLRRHPEVRWRRLPADLIAMQQRQRELLGTIASVVRPGGVLVYSVCSPEPEEGPEVVEAFLEAHRDFAVEATRTTAPPQRGEDAHHGCRLRRVT